MSNEQSKKPDAGARRKFLAGAAAATAGAATLGFPMIAKAQGPVSMRWQSTWPSKDIFHEYANDFAKKVNDMTGGDLRIEVLPAGAVVPAFGLLDAVSKGTLDGGHGVLVYHYGKQNALALWGSSPCYSMDANQVLCQRMLTGPWALAIIGKPSVAAPAVAAAAPVRNLRRAPASAFLVCSLLIGFSYGKAIEWQSLRCTLDAFSG